MSNPLPDSTSVATSVSCDVAKALSESIYATWSFDAIRLGKARVRIRRDSLMLD